MPLLHAHSCQGLHPQLAFTASAVPGFVAAETLGNKQKVGKNWGFFEKKEKIIRKNNRKKEVSALLIYGY